MTLEDVMKFRNLAVASVAAMALLGCGPVKAAADPATQCEVQQRQLLRVSLSVAAGQTTLDATAIQRVVDQLWAPEGVDVEWISETQAAAEDRLDAWVVVGRNAAELSNVPTRDNNVAHRVVSVSTDEVMGRFERSLSLQMQTTRESARHLMFGHAHLIERSLGFAVAHRLGHTALGLPHALTGLMSDDYNPSPGLTGVHAVELDAENRKLLQRRFGVGCVAAR